MYLMCTSRYNHWLDLKDTIYFTEHRKLAETIANSGAKLPLPQSLIDSYKNNVTMFPDNGDARALYAQVFIFIKDTIYIIIPLHNILLYKRNKTIWMFYGKFADEGDNPVNNPNIYNVEGDHKLSPSLQHLTTEHVLKILLFFFSPVLYLYFLYWKLFCCLLQNKTFKFLNIKLSTILGLTTFDDHLI